MPDLASGPQGVALKNVQGPSEPGWRVYKDKVPVTADIEIVKGKPQEDGSCTISQSGSMSPGDSPMQTDEIAFNLDSCESQFATYELTDSEARALEMEDAEGVESQVEESDTLDVELQADYLGVAATGQKDAYSRTWYEDPPGVDVTSVKNSVSWIYNYSCVTASTGGYKYNWYGFSGWTLQSDDFIKGHTCSRARSTSYARFRNGVFCASIDTYTTYDRNRIFGQENGTFTWSYDVNKSGGCTSLLSVRHTAAYQ